MEKEELSKLKITRPPDEPSGPRRLHKRKTAWLLMIPALLLLLGFLYGRGLLQPAQEVTITTVSLVYPSQAVTTLNASGYVVAQRKAAVASKGTGRLEFLAVEEGSRIKKGQIIARLENADLQAASAQARANLNAVRANLDQVRAEITNDRLRFERYQKLVQSKAIARSDFDVAAQERPIAMEFAGLALGGKIDRIDRLPDGQLLLIDYKTGRNTRSGWFPEPRIADPQLPAYAVAIDPPPGAIAFARIRPEDLRFDGLARGDAGTSGIVPLDAAKHKFKDLGDWEALLTSWRTHLEALAGEFRDGHAAVDPRNASVCTRCHLQAFCRIRERAPFEAADVDVAEGAGDE